MTTETTHPEHASRASFDGRAVIGHRLNEERLRIGLTQKSIAEKTGVSKRSQIDWEKGVATPNAEYLSAICSLGIDVGYVLNGIRISQSQLAQPEPTAPLSPTASPLTLKTPEQVREEFQRKGQSISAWAKARGVSTRLTEEILKGRRKAIRGESHAIAVLLGLKDGEVPDQYRRAA